MELTFADAGARALLAEFGLADLDVLAALDPERPAPAGARVRRVTTARTRRCLRLEGPFGVLYVKVQDLSGARLPLRKLPSYLLRGSPILREVEAARVLRAAGFRTPDYLAWGGRCARLLPALAAAVTRAVPGAVDLERFVREAAERERARRAADLAEELVRRAHARGLVLAGAKYRNLLVPAAGPESVEDFWLLDQPDLARSHSRRRRRRDLALLARDRHRFVEAV